MGVAINKTVAKWASYACRGGGSDRIEGETAIYAATVSAGVAGMRHGQRIAIAGVKEGQRTS